MNIFLLRKFVNNRKKGHPWYIIITGKKPTKSCFNKFVFFGTQIAH